MTSKVGLMCSVCGAAFDRPASEANRNARLGRPTYCSRSCSGKANLKNIPAGSFVWDHLRPNNRWDAYSPFRTCFRIARSRARLVGREFALTLDDLRAQWQKQDGVCPYTGWRMILPSSSHTYNDLPIGPRNASLDRIDSARGYTPGNIQFVSYMANVAKNDFTHEQMLDFCRAVAEHSAKDEPK